MRVTLTRDNVRGWRVFVPKGGLKKGNYKDGRN